MAQAQAIGWFCGAVALGVLACGIGVAKHSEWLIIPAVLGVMMSGVVVRDCHRWYKRDGKQPSDGFRAWWPRRGVWLLLSSGIPTWVAVGGMAFALRQKH